MECARCACDEGVRGLPPSIFGDDGRGGCGCTAGSERREAASLVGGACCGRGTGEKHAAQGATSSARVCICTTLSTHAPRRRAMSSGVCARDDVACGPGGYVRESDGRRVWCRSNHTRPDGAGTYICE